MLDYYVIRYTYGRVIPQYRIFSEESKRYH